MHNKRIEPQVSQTLGCMRSDGCAVRRRCCFKLLCDRSVRVPNEGESACMDMYARQARTLPSCMQLVVVPMQQRGHVDSIVVVGLGRPRALPMG